VKRPATTAILVNSDFNACLTYAVNVKPPGTTTKTHDSIVIVLKQLSSETEQCSSAEPHRGIVSDSCPLTRRFSACCGRLSSDIDCEGSNALMQAHFGRSVTSGEY